MRQGIHISGRDMAFDADLPLVRARKTNGARKTGTPQAVVLFGIEALHPDGWLPVTVTLGRRPRSYASIKEATDAAVAYWSRTGLAARPYRLN